MHQKAATTHYYAENGAVIEILFLKSSYFVIIFHSRAGEPYPAFSLGRKHVWRASWGGFSLYCDAAQKMGTPFAFLSGALPDVRRQYSGDNQYTDCIHGVSNAIEKAAS
jgi:hypothetical protein